LKSYHVSKVAIGKGFAKQNKNKKTAFRRFLNYLAAFLAAFFGATFLVEVAAVVDFAFFLGRSLPKVPIAILPRFDL
jgi:hypothetical protein